MTKSTPDSHPETSTEGIKAPPRRLLGIVAAIGPGIVVIGSIMGSGELINAPLQAAKFGFVLLWAVILSCVIKYFLQIEIGRHALAHDRTPLEALNSLPFPRFRGTSWIGLLFVLTSIPPSMSVAGMLALTAQVMDALLPVPGVDDAVSQRIWMVIMTIAVLAILLRGMYQHLEKLITVLVLGFSISVVMGMLLIQGTEFRITGDQFLSGLKFSLGEYPKAATFAVVSLMGGLGATANELFMYPYWIREKGYTKYTGNPNTPGWVERTRGWIRVLQVDAGICTILATIITAAYFLMGAAVLHGATETEGFNAIERLSRMFTASYGPWSQILFLFGAFCTLFSTMVVAIAALGRMWGDTLVSMKFIPQGDERALRRTHHVVECIYFAVLLPVAILAAQPEWVVILAQFFGGLVSMPLLILAICWLAFRTDRRVRMGNFSAICLVLSVIVIIACVVISQLT